MKFLIPSVWFFFVPDSGHFVSSPFASSMCSVILKAFQVWETSWQWISKETGHWPDERGSNFDMGVKMFSFSATFRSAVDTPLLSSTYRGHIRWLSVPCTLLWYSVWEQGTLFLTWTDSEFLLLEADTPLRDNELGTSECEQMQGRARGLELRDAQLLTGSSRAVTSRQVASVSIAGCDSPSCST